MDVLSSLVRMAVSLVAVLGLLLLLSRWVRRSRAGSAASTGEITVLNRASVGHKAGVAVVQVGDRALVLGVTESCVSLLAETSVQAVTAAPAEKRSAVRIPLQPGATLDLGATGPVQPPEAGSTDPGVTDPGVNDPGLTDSGLVVRGPSETALAGSAISPQTWIKAVDVLRDRTARR